MRIAIVNDAAGVWYLRRIKTVEHRGDDDTKMYHCDMPLGQPRYPTIDAAVADAKTLLSDSQ